MNAAVAIQSTPIAVYTPLETTYLYGVTTFDQGSRYERAYLYSSIDPGHDLIELFTTQRDRKPTTTRGYTTCLRQFARWISKNGITQPVFDDIQAYRDELAAREMTASSQAQYIRSIKAFFRWTASRGIYPDIAADINGAKVRHDGPCREALTMDEAETVRRSINRSTLSGKRLYAMYLLAVRRGLRVVEISRAKVEDLSEKNGVKLIRIWGKGHDEPDTDRALDGDTRDAIEAYLNARGPCDKSSPLFASTSNNSAGGPIAPTTISAMLKGALVAAGFDSPRITAHSLRHTAITAAVKCSGGNIHRGKDFARHVDPATTERYTHLDTVNDDAELVRVIERTYHGESADKMEKARAILDALDPEQLDKAIEYMASL